MKKSVKTPLLSLTKLESEMIIHLIANASEIKKALKRLLVTSRDKIPEADISKLIDLGMLLHVFVRHPKNKHKPGLSHECASTSASM